MEKYKKAIAKVLSKQLKEAEKAIFDQIEQPPISTGADYAYPCYLLAKKLKKSPVDIAAEVAAKIEKTDLIASIENRGPYVNFVLNKKLVASEIFTLIQKEKEKYGSLDLKKKKALIEHTSINPNAPPHVGRSRNAIIGDSLTRILKYHGYTTETHFFVNDIGKQIAMLVYALQGKKVPKFEDITQIYIDISKKAEEDPETEKRILVLLTRLEEGDTKIRKQFKEIVELCIKGQTKIFDELGIKYDKFDYESEYLFSKKTDGLLEELKKTGKVFTDSNGREILDLEGFDLPMKDKPVFVLTRADKTSLYGLRDLAYTLYKIKRAKDRNIVVLGEDHKLYFRQLEAALSILKQKAPTPVHYSFVLLSEGKMSTRSGNIIMLQEFMQEAKEKAEEEIKKRNPEMKKEELEKLSKQIGYGALKYSLLKVSPEKNVLFSWEKALSFEGESAPYIQYAYARINSIIRKANVKINVNADTGLLTHDKEKELIRMLMEFYETTKLSLDQLKPTFIANYAQKLAEKFNEFYHECPVITDDVKLKEARLLLIASVAQVLYNAFNLLGIEMPERM